MVRGKFIFMIFKLRCLLIIFLITLPLASCSKMGYGVLLWSVNDPPIMSGTVLPVYIRSNIDQVWVVGVPDEIKAQSGHDKIEVPLSQFEYIGNKRKAETRAAEFSEFALTYAENLQDGLPIRDNTDNNAKRVYRLRLHEIIKVLARVNGNPPISATGDPLPGDWLKVLTVEGVTGYCFSYRLKLFEQDEETLQPAGVTQIDSADSAELEMILLKTWSPDFYLQMVNTRRINIQSMEKNYRFEPGQEIGLARILLPDLERQFNYDMITPDGELSWRFEGTSLYMTLRSNTSLTVHFTDTNGARRTTQFVTLPTTVEDIIIQENARRESEFKTIYNQGPVFTSSNYGTLTLLSTGNFTWKGFELLIPQIFPAETNGIGRINMDLYISPSYKERYDGAFTLVFTDILTNNTFFFMYGLDNQGLRLEIIPAFGIEETVITRRDSSPMILYFFKDSP